MKREEKIQLTRKILAAAMAALMVFGVVAAVVVVLV